MEQKRILVVEDEASIRRVLKNYLSKQDCLVETAESAEAAIPLLEKTTYNAALVDIVLPGMDGLEMLARIKAVSEDTEVIVMTSHSSLDTATTAIRNGAYDYLKKPFKDLGEIWETLKRALDRNNLTLQNRELVKTLASQNKELQQAVMRRNSLIKAGRALSGVNTLPELLDIFVEAVVQELDANRASLMLLDGSGDELVIVASRGISENVIRNTRIKLGEGVAGKVAQSGEYILIEDEPDKWPLEALSNTPESFISAPILLSIPIKTGRRVLGVINITEKKTEGSYGESDVAFLQGLAGQAAVAIERARYTSALVGTIKRLEATRDQLVVSERLKALGEMAAGIAHDFNNVLNGILLTAQKLIMESNSSGNATKGLVKGLEVIETLTLQGGNTVKRIQEFTRIRKDQPTGSVHLNKAIHKAIEMTKPHWKEKKNSTEGEISIVTELGDVNAVIGSEVELIQVVINLIFNSTEAMPDGGTLKISTVQESNQVVLRVIDSGVGMSEEALKRLYEPFFTTKESGQGLGISIVYGIVTRHSGKIDVKSTKGEGTAVQITLPASESKPKEKDQTKVDEQSAEGGTGRVLVIEDEEINRVVLSEILSDAGYEVFLAEGGEQGFEVFDRENIDIVITDLSMPGISGWDVAKGIKGRSPETPVFLLSGWAIQEDEEEASQKGVDVLLSKPVSVEEILKAISTINKRKAA